MEIDTSRQKRPVPAGAKDLEIYDEVTCWRCPQCGLTSDKGIEKCFSCHSVAIKFKNAGAESLPVQLLSCRSGGEDHYFRCTNCEKCHRCKQPLKTHDYQIEEDCRDAIFDSGGDVIRGYNTFLYHYYHQDCAEQKRREEEKQQRIAEEEKRRRAEEYQQKQRMAEEEKRRRAEEYQQQRAMQNAQAELQRAQDAERSRDVLERDERKRTNRCMICGRVYGVSDDLGERHVTWTITHEMKNSITRWTFENMTAHAKCKDKPFSREGADDREEYHKQVRERIERHKKNVCMICGGEYSLLNDRVEYTVTHPSYLLTLREMRETICAHKNCRGKPFQW